jgi:hypothetical protein
MLVHISDHRLAKDLGLQLGGKLGAIPRVQKTTEEERTKGS